MKDTVLVIGGGIAGMTAAGALADLGHPVVLVERSSALGGRASRLHRTFPELRPADEIVEPLVHSMSVRRGIKVHLSTEVVSLGKGNEPIVELSDGSAVEVGAVVIATGLETVPTDVIPEYGHGQKDGVVTSVGLEEMLRNGQVVGRTGAPPRSIVLVQCVGSRTERRGVPYCSAVCCANALKDAVVLKDTDPSVEVTILYIDIRAGGKGQESLYRTARRRGVRFIRGQPSLVMERANRLVVCGENTLLRELYEIEADLVVLCVGLRQSPENLLFLDGLGVHQGTVGFPSGTGSGTNRPGLFVCGTARGPADLPSSMAQARSCALDVHLFLQSKENGS